ncbi:MAG: hypothetical protein OJF48_003104 [Afipia sp.]|jgi:hypothetical protein|nr:MAG: hypothetical protein OJF48_003104 [Afipia sp.]
MAQGKIDRRPTTLAEAIDALEQRDGFVAGGRTIFHIARLNLNSGKHTHLVVIEYRHPLSAESTFITLQSGNVFRAIERSSIDRREYSVELLDGGIVSLDATVTLENDAELHAVEIVPERLPYKLSPLDQKIIQAAISIAKIENAVYRSFRHGISEEDAKRIVVVDGKLIEFGEFIDRFKFIDFGKLAQVEIPSLLLLNIKGEFEKLFPTERSPSEQKISDTLTLAGFWKPKRRTKS